MCQTGQTLRHVLAQVPGKLLRRDHRRITVILVLIVLELARFVSKILCMLQRHRVSAVPRSQIVLLLKSKEVLLLHQTHILTHAKFFYCGDRFKLLVHLAEVIVDCASLEHLLNLRRDSLDAGLAGLVRLCSLHPLFCRLDRFEARTCLVPKIVSCEVIVIEVAHILLVTLVHAKMMENLTPPGQVDLDSSEHVLDQVGEGVARILLLIQILHAPATI